MSEATGLTLTGGVRLDGMGDVWALAERLAKADGFVPRPLVGKPNQIAAVILTGLELGIGPMTALRGIHIVDGKPTMSAEMMLARARQAGVRTRWVETTDKVARLAVTVQGDTEPQVMAFTWDEANRAGVTNKDNWRKYPAAMLRARCLSAAMRAFCPEALGVGVYESTSGELSDGRPSAPAVTVEVTDAPPNVDGEAEAIVLALFEAKNLGELAAAKERFKAVKRRLTDEQRGRIDAAGVDAKARIEAAMAGEERGA
jgi:hypothetical protein